MSEIVKQLTEGLNELVQERQKLIDERDNLKAKYVELDKLISINGAVNQVEIFRQGIYFMQQCIHRIGNVDHTVEVDLSDYISGLDVSICGDIETELNVSDIVGEYVGDEITDDEIRDIIKDIK
jgi:predicted nuclease with TOPRIM domain